MLPIELEWVGVFEDQVACVNADDGSGLLGVKCVVLMVHLSHVKNNEERLSQKTSKIL